MKALCYEARGAAQSMPKHAPKALQNPARRAPKPFKIEVRGTQELKFTPETTQTSQDTPKSAQEAAKRRLRSAQGEPRDAQERPKAGQEVPQTPPKARRASPETSF